MMAATRPAAEMSRVRTAVYRFLIAALSRPTPEQREWMISRNFRQSLEALCDNFGVCFVADEESSADFADHESRYLACFEVGLPVPPVVLAASHYNRREPVPRVLHEHILLYRHFGVRVPESSLEAPDHIVHQLAFLVRLDELQLEQPAVAESVVRARHDFLHRHVVPWVKQAAEAARDKDLPSIYCTLLMLLAAAVRQDQELTDAALANLPGESS